MDFNGIGRELRNAVKVVRKQEADARRGIADQSSLNGFNRASKFASPDRYFSRRAQGEELGAAPDKVNVNKARLANQGSTISSKTKNVNTREGIEALRQLGRGVLGRGTDFDIS